MAGKTLQIPTLPSIGTSVDPEVRRSFDILKNFFAALRANGGFGNQTIQQTIIQQTGGGGGGGGDSIINPPSPPAISGFTATGAFSAIIINWNDTGYSNYGYTEIWRSTTDDLGTALYVGESSGIMYCDTPPTASISVTYYYWARVVSYTGLTGPWSGTSGVPAHTASNPAYVLQSLAGEITASELATDLGTKITGIEAGATLGALFGTNLKMLSAAGTPMVATEAMLGTLSGSLFLETFESPIETTWNTVAEVPSNVANISYPSFGQAGGKVFHTTSPQYWGFPRNIPLDPSKLYRMRIRVRKTAHAGTSNASLVAGLNGYAADGVTLVNYAGVNSWSPHSLVMYANLTVSDTWTEVTGYFKGWAAAGVNGTSAACPNPTSPSLFHANVRYIRPFFFLNLGGSTIDTFDLDYISLDIIPENADQIVESSTKKWAAESGATVGAQAGVNLKSSTGNALNDSAIITAQGISADTASVSGLPSSTVASRPNGTQILANPEFAKGLTGWTVYDNAASGNVSLSVNDYSIAPNSSGKILTISIAGGEVDPSPGVGGFYCGIPPDNGASKLNTYHRGSTIIWRIIASFPSNCNLGFASNSYGDDGTITALTSMIGTGDWATYVFSQKIGRTGTFSSTGFFYLYAPSRPLTWWVALCEAIDISQSASIYLSQALKDSTGSVLNDSEVVTSQGTAAAISGQGALATKNSVNLATAEVTNKTLDYIADTPTRSIATLQSGVNAVQLAMNAVNAEITLKADVNGHVTGIGLIGGARSGQVIILADQFAVLLPNGTGTPKVPFVVGTIGGVPGVGISGALLVDGSITANSIVGQTISGDKLATANLLAYSAQIADGIITNAKISALDAGKITTGYLNANRIQSGSIDGKITSITGGQIQTGTITADHIIADAVTDKDEKFIDYECDGGESDIDVLTSTPITLSPGAVILVIANASGSPSLYTMNLSRTYGAVTQKVASIHAPFSLAYSDRVDTSISPEMTRFHKPAYVVTANYSIYGGSGSESSQGQGQSFVADAGGYTLGAVAFRFQKVGAPTDNLVVTVTDGLNPGNVVASGTYPMASFSGSKKTVTITLQNPGALTGGQTYYVKLTRSGGYDSSNYVRIWGWNDSRSGSSGRFSCNGNTWNSPGTTDVKFSTFALITGSESWTYTLNLAADNPEGSGSFLSTDALSAQLTVLQVKR